MGESAYIKCGGNERITMFQKKIQTAAVVALLSFFVLPLHAEAAGEKIKVVSYNIQGGCSAPMDEGSYNIDKTIQVLKNAQADVILLQEVQSGSSTKGTCSAKFNKNQAQQIGEALGMEYKLNGTVAIISKYKIKSSSPGTFKSQKAGGSRKYLRAVLELPSKVILYVYNAHLERFDKAVRLKQIDEYVGMVQKETGATIAGGDFNECATNVVFQKFAGFKESVGTATTFTPKPPTKAKTINDLVSSSSCGTTKENLSEHIDYIFADQLHWNAESGGVITSAGAASDHYPIYTVFSLTDLAFAGQGKNIAANGADSFFNSLESGNETSKSGNETKPLTDEKVQEMLRKPVPRIKIPGLTFSEPVAQEVTDINGEKQIFVKAPFLGEYISAVFRYGIIFLSLLSVTLIIISGMQWVLSGGGDGKSEVLKRIEGSIIGLVVAVGSYVILYTLNPELVSFKSLNIPFLQPLPVRPDYDETEIDEGNGIIGLSRYVNGKELTASDKCLEQEFFAGRIGMLPEIAEVEMFGVQKIKMNKNAIPALEIVSNEVLEKAKTDPEVAGYLQYMKDFKEKKVPDLLGNKDGAGTFSTAISKIGYYRKGAEKGQPRTCLRCDMHAPGLAVDIMTRSNWDVRWGGSAKGEPATHVCGVYKRTLEKMKTGEYGAELKKDPYHMFDRLEKKIASCLNHFNNGTEPYTSLPDGIVSAFESNGFYWGGWGWGKLRSDSMHFEYLGKCAGSKGGNKGGPADAYKLQKDLMCCKVNATGDEATVSNEKECTEKQGTVISTGAC